MEQLGQAEPAGLDGPLSERQVIDALPGAVVVTDPAGRIVLWSTAAEALYGWSEAEVVGRSVLEVLSPFGARATDDRDLAAVAGGRARRGDRLVARRDGATIRVHTTTCPVRGPDGAVLAIVGSAVDVDDLRRAEQRTRDLSEHLRAAVEAGGLGTWRWDLRSGATVWDERLEALFGLPPGGFAGSFDAYVAMIDPADRDEVLTTVQHAVDTAATYRVEHKVVWPDGSTHWIAGAGGVTVDEDGSVTGTVGCCMDITDRIVQEQEHQHLAGLAMDAAGRERLLRQRLQFLSDINDALLAASTLPELMANVTASAVPRLGDWCSIHVLPFEGGTVPHVEVAHVDPAMVTYARQLQQRFPFDPDAPAGVPQVIRTGATAFLPDVTADMVEHLDLGDELRHVITGLALARTWRCRWRSGGASSAPCSSSCRRPGGVTPRDDVTLAHTVADRIASSIENLRLYEQQRLIARTLQRSLLPAALPEIPAVEIAVRYWPAGEANEVGGDFYDVFPLGPDRWAIVVGDVCGTGPAAAALTGLARHTIRDSAWHDDSPVGVLGALDRAVRNSATGSFLTAVYATLDTSGDRPELTVTSGGHPLPSTCTVAAPPRSWVSRARCSAWWTTSRSSPTPHRSNPATSSCSTPTARPMWRRRTASTDPGSGTSSSGPSIRTRPPSGSPTGSTARWRPCSRSAAATTTSHCWSCGWRHPRRRPPGRRTRGVQTPDVTGRPSWCLRTA